MKRACIATTEIEVPIVVDDADPDWKDKARRTARDAMRDELSNMHDSDFTIGNLSHIPGSYDLESLVYHDGPGDIEVAEAIKMPGGYAHDPDVHDPSKAS